VLKLTRFELARNGESKRNQHQNSNNKHQNRTSQAPEQPENQNKPTKTTEKRGKRGISQHMSENQELSSRKRERGAYIPEKEKPHAIGSTAG